MSQTVSESTSRGNLSLWSKVVYGTGDIFGGGSLALVDFLYAIFLTDVVLLSPLAVSVIIFGSHAWTALVQLWVGRLSDRTESRHGRRRVFFLFTGWTIPLVLFGMWFPVFWPFEVLKTLNYLFWSLCFFTVYNLLIVPYNALGAEIVRSYDGRSSLNAVRLFFSCLAIIVCTSLPLLIVRYFDPDLKLGYGVMAIGFGLVFALPWYAIYAVNKEPARVSRIGGRPGGRWAAEMRTLLANRTVLRFAIMVTVSALAIKVTCLLVAYYVKYYFLRVGDLPLILLVVASFQTLSVPIYLQLSYRIGKSPTYIMGTIVACLGGIGLFLMPSDMGLGWLLVFFALVGVGMSAILAIPYFLFGDVADLGALLLGRRVEGLLSGAHVFLINGCAALGKVSMIVILGVSGFVAPRREMVDGVVQLIDQPQSELVLTVLRVATTLLPLFLFLVGMVVLWRYPLTRERHDRLATLLERIEAGDECERERRTLLEELN
ncbi:MAG: MFS transporter [Bradymonadales bacterium]|nr:MFS transporter [Bradymonadales bacterium]